MDQYIEVTYGLSGRRLLNRFEYSGGVIPNDKDQKARDKMEKKGEIEVIQHESQFTATPIRPIARK